MTANSSLTADTYISPEAERLEGQTRRAKCATRNRYWVMLRRDWLPEVMGRTTWVDMSANLSLDTGRE